jgi:hypothetical protein
MKVISLRLSALAIGLAVSGLAAAETYVLIVIRMILKKVHCVGRLNKPIPNQRKPVKF